MVRTMPARCPENNLMAGVLISDGRGCGAIILKFLFSVSFPIGLSGYFACGHVKVLSKMSMGALGRSLGSMTCTYKVQVG